MLTAKDDATDVVEGLAPAPTTTWPNRSHMRCCFGCGHCSVVGRRRDPRCARPAICGWIRGAPGLAAKQRNPLTPREFAVMEFLLHHPGEVLSKKDILDHVWDFDFDGDPNIVEVYIRRLRMKLDQPMIETVRGAGYRLVAAGA